MSSRQNTRQFYQDKIDAVLGKTSTAQPTDQPVTQPTVPLSNAVESKPNTRQFYQDKMDAVLGKTVTGQPTDQPVTQPVAAPSDQPEYTMDDLDTNREWIKNAKTFHQHLEGEDWKGSDKSLAEWFKRRHAQLNNDIVNMGTTALSVKDMDDATKKSLVDSMDMYDDTDSDWGSFWRSLRYMATDPTTLATIPFSVATGGVATAAKLAGTKGANAAARFALKDQIKKQLIEKGISKEAAKEIIKTGASKEVSEEVIKQVVKDSAKKVALTTGGTGFAGGAAYGAAMDLADQSLDLNLGRVYDNDVYERFIAEGMSPEEARELSKVEDIDYKRLALATGIGGLVGGIIPVGITKTSKYFLNKKVGNAAVRAERLAEKEAVNVANLLPTETIVVKSPDKLNTVITDASQRVADDGELVIEIPARARKNKKTGKTVPMKPPKKLIASIEEATNKSLNILDPVVEELADKSIRITGRNNRVATEEVIVDASGRSFVTKALAKFQRGFSSAGAGDQAQKIRRQQLDQSAQAAQRGVQNAFRQLNKAIKKDFKTSSDNLDNETLNTLDLALRGGSDALSTLASTAPNVVKQLTLMRGNIKNLQEQLLATEAIKEGSTLDATIRRSMESPDGKPELYVNTTYEVFDNPNFSREFIESDEGQKASERLREIFSSEYAEINEGYRLAKKAQMEAKLDKSKKLTPEEEALINFTETNRAGDFNQRLEKLLSARDEADLFQGLGQAGTIQSGVKVLNKKQNIPEVIRTVMGERKNPFANYSNTMRKLTQTVETINYEKAMAEAVKKGEVKGASVGRSGDITQALVSRLPSRSGVSRPLADKDAVNLDLPEDLQELLIKDTLSKNDPAAPKLTAEELKRVADFEDENIQRPLLGLFGTPEVQNTILQGNEFAADLAKPLQTFMLLQGYTRAAKTVYSFTAVARNFIGGGYMALGAGYLNPLNVSAMYKTAKGLSMYSDEELRAVIEKGISLGYLQSGVDLGTFRGALQDAGKDGFWNLSDPIYQSKGFLNKVKKKGGNLNRSMISIYQSMDDMWKSFGYLAEKDNHRQVLIDQGINPDQVMRTLRSSDGLPIEITRLDEVAAAEVNKHMQNYNGVPQFIRAARTLPFADFLSFKYEMIRTQGNLIKSSFKDLREGSDQMKLGIKNPDGSLQGQAQRNLGRKRLGSLVVAQASAPALALGVSTQLGLEEKVEPDSPYTIRQGIEYFNQDFAKGSGYLYTSYDPKTGKGNRVNLSYLNPWAASPQNDPLRAGMRAFDQGEYVDGAVDDALYRGTVQPILDTVSMSMFGEAVKSLAFGEDQYGRPLSKSPLWDDQAIARLREAGKAFEPGIVKSGRDIYKGFAVGRTKSGRELDGWDETIELSGVKNEKFDMNREVGYKLSGLVKDMGGYNDIFNEIVRDRRPRDVSEFVDAYKKVLDLQYARSTEIFDAISHAKSAGLDNKDIFRAITDDGVFKNRFDKQVLRNMIKTGKFIPSKPNNRDISKWGQSIKRSTGYTPPTREVLQEINKLFSQYAGTTTGVR